MRVNQWRRIINDLPLAEWSRSGVIWCHGDRLWSRTVLSHLRCQLLNQRSCLRQHAQCLRNSFSQFVVFSLPLIKPVAGGGVFLRPIDICWKAFMSHCWIVSVSKWSNVLKIWQHSPGAAIIDLPSDSDILRMLSSHNFHSEKYESWHTCKFGVWGALLSKRSVS